MHKITGKELLSLLANFPADAYPDGIAESDVGALTLHGEVILSHATYRVWSCNGDRPLHRFDSDWTVDAE